MRLRGLFMSRAWISNFLSLSRIGATVTLVEKRGQEKTAYTIVGVDESDIRSDLLSATSLLARGLIGNKEGDEVSTPRGLKVYAIVRIVYE